MAAYTAGKVADGELAYVTVNYTARPYSPLTFNVDAPEGDSELVVQTKDPGDYPVIFAASVLGSSLETLYTASERTTGIVRDVVLANETGSEVTVSLFIAGVCVEPGISVPAGESRGQQTPGWMLPTGASLKASGEGVSVFATGIEEVR